MLYCEHVSLESEFVYNMRERERMCLYSLLRERERETELAGLHELERGYRMRRLEGNNCDGKTSKHKDNVRNFITNMFTNSLSLTQSPLSMF